MGEKTFSQNYARWDELRGLGASLTPEQQTEYDELDNYVSSNISGFQSWATPALQEQYKQNQYLTTGTIGTDEGMKAYVKENLGREDNGRFIFNENLLTGYDAHLAKQADEGAALAAAKQQEIDNRNAIYGKFEQFYKNQMAKEEALKKQEEERIKRQKYVEAFSGLAHSIGDIIKAHGGAVVTPRDFQSRIDALDKERQQAFQVYQARMNALNDNIAKLGMIRHNEEREDKATEAGLKFKYAELEQKAREKAAELGLEYDKLDNTMKIALAKIAGELEKQKLPKHSYVHYTRINSDGDKEDGVSTFNFRGKKYKFSDVDVNALYNAIKDDEVMPWIEKDGKTRYGTIDDYIETYMYRDLTPENIRMAIGIFLANGGELLTNDTKTKVARILDGNTNTSPMVTRDKQKEPTNYGFLGLPYMPPFEEDIEETSTGNFY